MDRGLTQFTPTNKLSLAGKCWNGICPAWMKNTQRGKEKVKTDGGKRKTRKYKMHKSRRRKYSLH